VENQQRVATTCLIARGWAYLGEGTVVPEVALVGEAVAHKAKLALLDVLLDGVEELILGDLFAAAIVVSMPSWKGHGPYDSSLTHLKLGIGPARNLNDHVQDRLFGIGKQGDIVEGRDGDAILFDVDAVLEGVGGSHLADAVLGSHDSVW
jgi:hypothetical protein